MKGILAMNSKYYLSVSQKSNCILLTTTALVTNDNQRFSKKKTCCRDPYHTQLEGIQLTGIHVAPDQTQKQEHLMLSC